MGRWTDVVVGERIGPVPFVCDERFVSRFVRGAGNELEVHRELVDPTIAGNLAIFLLVHHRYPGPIIHSHQDLRFHAPVPVGETVLGTGEVTLKQMRRDKAYVAVDCLFRRASDDVLAWEARMTCVWPEVHLRGEA